MNYCGKLEWKRKKQISDQIPTQIVIYLVSVFLWIPVGFKAKTIASFFKVLCLLFGSAISLKTNKFKITPVLLSFNLFLIIIFSNRRKKIWTSFWLMVFQLSPLLEFHARKGYFFLGYVLNARFINKQKKSQDLEVLIYTVLSVLRSAWKNIWNTMGRH